MVTYKQLSSKERENLYLMRNQGMNFRDIAKILHRSHTTLSREMRRNALENKELGYLPDSAQRLAEQKKAKHGSKISRNPHLLSHIVERLGCDGWSPSMISGRLKRDNAKVTISHEAIYQYIYSEAGIAKKLYNSLPHRRPKRQCKYGRKARQDYGIPNRVPIEQRPAIKDDEFGHIEADTTFFKGSQSINLCTMVERSSGYLFAGLNQSKKSDDITDKLLNNILKIPRKHRKTLTMDNGKEFVKHGVVQQITGIKTFFCNPGSPWEKPYVETTHAYLHRFLPKNTDPTTLTEKEVQDAVRKVNNLPRKRLGFKTPSEVFYEKNAKFGALQA